MKQEAKKIGTELVKAVETMKETAGVKQAEKAAKAEMQEKTDKVQKSVEALKNKEEEMKREYELRTAELQKCLASLERMKQLSNNRTAFMNALDNLNDAAEKLGTDADFETKLYRLRFSDATAYGNDNIFTISNTFILREFVEFMQTKIKERIALIEQELIKG